MFSFRYSNLEDEEMRMFYEDLKTNTSLKSLKLGLSSKAEVSSVGLIFEVLKVNRTLEELDLRRGFYLSKKEENILFTIIQENQVIKKLNFKHVYSKKYDEIQSILLQRRENDEIII